ncbi:hypothetical protein BH708_06715 [Brachybacterium sp. P6-10-X1]|uniref:DUF6541 family protein n=1 Tax=Brachybacterium sp. P6-10-X1 TaxID=1903186 RepID=UPI0009717A60|nr:DUF6541 family protein [Brachybacterium sp. P6-10-X1]APX32464.1 hypothetical protein BH708_06715 [Brachybacterium sp. P6-10-X1]
MSWILPVLGAWALLGLPGLLLLRAVGARVRLAWGYSPVVTVLTMVLLSGLFSMAGIEWQLGTVLAGVVLLGVLAVLLRRWLVRWDRSRSGAGRDAEEQRGGRDGAPPWPGAVVTAVGILGGLLVVVAGTRRMGGISTLNGSYDSFFHLSAIATIRDGGDAFLTTALEDIYGEPTYYPVTFDALAALLPLETISAANALMLALLAALPCAVGAMVAAIAPRGRAAGVLAALAALASTLFLSTPAMGLVMGLWPIVLGVLCLPIAIASAILLVDRRHGPLTLPAAAGYGALLLGTTLAHPSMLFSVAVVAGLLVLVSGLYRIREGQRRRGMIQVGLALAAAVAFMVVSGTLLGGMDLTQPGAQGMGEVLREILVDSPRIPVIGAPLWPLAVIWLLAIVGAVAALRRREVVGVTAALGVLAAIVLGVSTQIDSPLTTTLVNPWYGARERIAPLMMCLLVLLMARGVLALSTTGRGRMRSMLAPGAAALVLITVVAGGLAPGRLPLLGSLAYTAYGLQLSPYVTSEEREFIERTAAALPEDAVVLADPLDGAPLYWSVGGVETVYPTMSRPLTEDTALIAGYAQRVDHPSANAYAEICAAVDQVGPTHLYRDTSEHSGARMNPEVSARWSGVHDIPPDRLTLLAREGPYALYELDLAC